MYRLLSEMSVNNIIMILMYNIIIHRQNIVMSHTRMYAYRGINHNKTS